ncbi:MAG: response regulator [Treponema sp.]|nr:response regulator [Treponema sp.]
MGKIIFLCEDAVSDSPLLKIAEEDFSAVRMGFDAKEVVAATTQELTDLIAVYVNDFTADGEKNFERIMAHVKNVPFVLIGEKDRCHEIYKHARGEIAADIFTPITSEDFKDKFNRAVCKALGLPESPEKKEEEKSEDEEEPQKKLILVVDDDAVFLRTMKNWLNNNYRVSVVKSGPDALDFLEMEIPDLILLDYEMPGYDGVRTLARIRKDERFVNIPVVFLTGVSEMDMVKDALAQKPQGYILKKTTQSALLEKVAAVLEKDE